jgi:hypothetical protein
MTSDMRSGRNHILAVTLALVALLIGAECSAAWKLEENVGTPSYAVTEPTSSNLNIDSVVLMCEATGGERVLQLKVYLTDDGPLRPNGVAPEKLKADPRAEISVDGKVFPVAILFADEFAVLADDEHEHFPLLSDRLLDAMMTGKRMVLRFDLAAEPPGQAAAFDAEAKIELAPAAIAAVRRCAAPPAAPADSVAFAGH